MPTTLEDLVIAARAPAYAGDVDQASRLIGLLPDAKRGEEVAAAYRARIPVPAFREMLSSAWQHDHDKVLRAAGHRDATLRKWFVYADFDLTHIPDHVTIFRGGVCFKTDDRYWQCPASLCWGHSWSIDRDAACFFASVFGLRRADGYPCVVSIRVHRRRIFAFLPERSESEVVAFTRGSTRHIIDGVSVSATAAGFDWRPSDELQTAWRTAGERYSKRHPR